MIKWRKPPYSTYLRATGSKEKAIELANFMKKNEQLRRLIIEEYS